ncbi:F-box domain containing protein [Pseudohyphozyma bogoriensis]|nr:F-box domain containing protein [Pseudohyphozyma bogoriensis]
MQFDPRPDSPPSSTTTKDSGSRSPPPLPCSDTTTLTPPKSPSAHSQSSTSSSPSPAFSPLPPLPAEVCLLILRHLPPPALEPLLGVSRAFHQFLNDHPSLWPSFQAHLHFQHSIRTHAVIRRSSVNHKNPGGGIRDALIALAAVTLPNGRRHQDYAPTPVVDARLKEVLDALIHACVPYPIVDAFTKEVLEERPSTLETLKMQLYPNTLTSHRVMSTILFVNWYINIPDLRLSTNFLSLYPNLVTSRLMCSSPTAMIFPSAQPIRLTGMHDNRRRPIVCPALPLETIAWTGFAISRTLEIPLLPRLTTLTLENVVWDGRKLFYLLRLARKTLVSLDIRELLLRPIEDPEEDWDDWSTYVDVRDQNLVDGHIFPPRNVEIDDELSDFGEEEINEPAPIIFPNLKSLFLAGETTPPLFSSLEYADTLEQASPYPTPVFVMPSLESAGLDQIVVEQDGQLEEGEGPLTVLGRNAPELTTLALTSSIISDEAIFQCLAGMGAKLVTLSLYDTELSDQLLLHLPELVPELEDVDVRKTEVTLQGVARFVERFRDVHDGRKRIKSVRVDPPSWERWSEAEGVAYEWLIWVDVFVRDESDYEGDGPKDEKSRRKWKKSGKLPEGRVVLRNPAVQPVMPMGVTALGPTIAG